MCYLQDVGANQELTEAIRGCIKDRATWFYLLLQGAKEQGANAEELANKAIFKFGQLKAKKIGDVKNPREFFDGIASKNSALAFAMEEVKVEENQGIYRFHHCALCDAWRELGCSQEEINQLCKLAMQGDYGLVSDFPLELNFNSTIGEGAECCEMVITKKEK
jgi:hypothetical protein